MKTGKTVIVIGGGIAGLAAALELLQNGCRVTLLEARNRLGGRIHTRLDASCPIELGAEFIHGRDEQFLELVRSAGLSVEHGPEKNRILSNGEMIQVDLWKKSVSVFERADLHEHDQSCDQFLKGQKLLISDRRHVTELLQGFHAAPVHALSTHALRRSDYSSAQMDGTRQFRVSGGYRGIIAHLEEGIRELHGHICLHSPVKHIEWLPGSVEVTLQHDDGEDVYRAEAAVIALPLGVLKHGDIQFHPLLHEKDEAIHGLGVGTVTKVVLLFKERWWKEADVGIVHSYEERLPTWWSDPRGPILTGWAGGPKGAALAGLPTSALENIALEALSRIFGESPSVLRQMLRQVFTHDWINDRHALGAYSYIPVNGLDLPKLLAAPLKETLFFAGEAAITDAQTGMTFNAYRSGLRAAREVLEAEHQVSFSLNSLG